MGHFVSKERIKHDLKKIKTISEMLAPQDCSTLNLPSDDHAVTEIHP